ncbi:arrestin domain-containing protein [Metarhizium anisopliae]
MFLHGAASMYRYPPPVPAAAWPATPRRNAYRLGFHLEQHFNAKIYTSGSPVRGHVLLRPAQDIAYDDFEISLVGVSSTQNLLQHESGIVAVPFMKLVMPLCPDSLPASKIFAAGQEYLFRFHFVLPFHLAIGSCRHGCVSPAVKELHLRPPPTMGFWEGDDQSPQMTQIKYAVAVLATRRLPPDPLPARVIAESSMIRVLPAFPEDAPLDITPVDDGYALSRSKTIRRNFVAGKLGRLTATAAQPKAVMLSPDGHAASATSCRLTLVFDSVGAGTPSPRISSVSGKLTSHTYFDMSFMNRLPNLGNRPSPEATSPYRYTTSTKLFSLPVGDLPWREERAESAWEEAMFPLARGVLAPTQENPSRRASAATCPDMESSMGSRPRRCVAELDIQFTIPRNNRKMFLPTFHSCRISRTYTLHLCLAVGQTFSTLSLVVPLQIGVESASDNRIQQHEFRTAPGLALVRGPDHARRNTYAGLPGYMLESSDHELPGYC